MRIFKAEGIVIKRINFGEADRIITVLTKDHGKIAVKASGVRKITSRRSSQIELLNQVILTLHNGHKFPILGEAHMLESYEDIKSDLTKVGHAYHVCELIDGLCPENQENARAFFLLKNMLTRMSQIHVTREMVEAFEIELLTTLGFWNREFASQQVDTQDFIENILERRLKSKKIFAKLQ